MDGLPRFAPRPDQAPKMPVVRHHIDHPSAWKVSFLSAPKDPSLRSG